MSEKIRNQLYLGHAFIIWAGSIWQIYHIFTQQSAKDITLLWIVALLVSEIMALPRACHGHKFWVWAWCHKIGVVLISILLVGVILYHG